VLSQKSKPTAKLRSAGFSRSRAGLTHFFNSKGATVSDQPISASASSGLSDNAAGALAYVTIIPSIIFLVMEPYNRNSFIKFHAWQNIFLCIFLFVLAVIGIIPILGWLVLFVGSIAALIFWVIAIINAYKGVMFKIPIIGNIAEKQAGA
jgi:uncharacterized membrane protein